MWIVTFQYVWKTLPVDQMLLPHKLLLIAPLRNTKAAIESRRQVSKLSNRLRSNWDTNVLISRKKRKSSRKAYT